jgi:RNA ligase (TIGR02306 family)
MDLDYEELNKLMEDENYLNEYFGIKHYVPPAVGASFGNLQMVGTIPFGIPKTDEENVQNLRKEDIPFGEEVLITRKLDGTSCTVIFDNDGKYHVCGRNYEYKLNMDNIYINNTKEVIETVKNCDYCKFLKPNEHLVIQGEIAGKGIQSNKINKISQIEEPKFYIFRTMIWNDKDRTKCDMGNYKSSKHFTEFVALTNTVPIIGKAILTQELIDKYINAPAEDGEGVVINHKNGHFKIKSLDYISKF